ncbi:hypothetical protein FE810_15085 [Thalassotalea litorea]|uniref:Uncharacterized protein n=1 Tax=Thalassotalea litorea TaxID=2020715 RepID=A0A5R9ID98_9GAMM|nr:hypothetical protein [Thalassotalea litorea]TLU61333.1 hypothetical protein FE810_15085 [Thalassotalea litorea]
MKLVQSRKQNIFNRFYLTVIQQWWVIMGAVIALVIGDTLLELNVRTIWLGIATAVVLSVLVGLWLIAFNSGRNAIIEYGIELDEDGVHFIRYGSKRSISWREYSGFEVLNRSPRMIRIKQSGNKPIEFSYYTFSKPQRERLFESLARQ